MRKMLNAFVLLGLLIGQFNAPLATHAQGVGDTPTPTESTQTPTAEATATATDTPTAAPTEDTATEPPSTAGTETPSPTATDENTATPSASVTPSLPAITLSLTPTPQFVTPGGMATLHWTITGIDLAVHTLSLQAVLPEGVTPKAGEGTYDSATRTLTLATAAATGQFHLSVQAVAAPITIVVTLVEGGQALTDTTITILTQEDFVLSISGGQVSAMGGKIKINIPPGALPEQTRISVGQADKAEAPRGSLSGHAFAIRAYGMQTETVLHQFSKRIEIEAHYADFGIEPGHEQELYVWWYNPDTGGWAALQSEADASTGIIKGYTDHFSLFDINIEYWQTHMMPSVDAFQVASFTGAATYSLPIQVPDGPGGLKPDLALSYNSQVVDQSTTDTQPGWVGMGWTLDTGSIVADDHGDDDWANDSWLLSMGGFTTRVVKLTTGEYRMLDERFWKISYNLTSDYWTVTDKNGNDYFFEEKSQRVVPNHCVDQREDHLPSFSYRTYQWSLTRVRNIFNQQLTYGYTHETKNIPHDTWISGTGNCITTSDSADTAVYPSMVTYPGGHLRVRFELQSRLDYPSDWLTDAANHAFQRQRLKKVFVEEDPDGTGPLDFDIMRKYVLTYTANGEPTITFPGFTFTAQGQMSTLAQVQLFGVNGSGSLPPTTFTYDGLHLVSAANNYGGDVAFSYETTPWKATSTSAGYSKTDNAGTLFEAYGVWSTLSGTLLQPSTKLNVYNRTLTNPEYDKEMVRPRGAYYLKATKESSSTNVQVGLDIGDSILWACDGTNEDCPTATLYLPLGAREAAPVMRAAPGSINPVYVTEFKYELRPTFHRVLAKIITDGQTDPYSWTYSYSEPAMNDVSNTVPCASPCVRYFPRHTEFRGHGTVTETGPGGRVTTTTFSQGSTDPAEGDALKGRPLTVTVTGGTTLTKTLYTYNVLPYPDTFAQPTGFGDVLRTRARTNKQENRTYTNNGSNYSAIVTEYGYDAYGNVTSQNEHDSYRTGTVVTEGPLYRSTLTDYSANTDAYLVGLPGRVRVLDGAGHTQAATIYLYDDNTDYAEAPDVGKLSGQRTLLRCGESCNTAPYYRDETFGYDSWGNRTRSTVYPGEGTLSLLNQGTAQSTYTCYGSGGTDSFTCDMPDGIGVHAYPLWTRNPLGQVTSWTYIYSKGVPLSETDPNGVTATATYDAFGRMLTLTRLPDTSATLTMSYNDTNQASVSTFVTTIAQKVDDGPTYNVVRTYDGLGRQITVEAGGITTDYGYDAYGHITSQSTPYQTGETAYTTVTGYDALGRPKTIIGTDGSYTTNDYNGLVTTVTVWNHYATPRTALSNTVTTNDVWGNVSSVVPENGTGTPIPPSVNYTDYDILGHLKSVTRGGATTTIQYDKAGRKTSMTDADMGAWTYGYDSRGNLTQQTDARGCTLTMTYDALSRPTSKSAGTGCSTQLNTHYYYDEGGAEVLAVGHRTRMTSGSVSNTWTYDERGRVLSTTLNTGTEYQTSWTYNSADLPISVEYPDQETVTYGYNPRMLLNSVDGAAHYLAPTGVPDPIEYDSAGRVTSRALGNGLTQHFAYYAWDEQGGRLDQITTGTWDYETQTFSDTTQHLDYEYDPVGNVSQIVNSIADETSDYSYDALDRLTSWKLNGGTPEAYNYYPAEAGDPDTGNLKAKGSLLLAYGSDGLGAPAPSGCQGEGSTPRKIAHAVSSAGGNTYSYDCNGNMIQRVIGQDTFALSYDAENRLVEVQKNNVTIAQFTYDGDGNRVQSTITVNQTTTTTTFVGNYFETDGTNATKYYYAGASRVAMRTCPTLNCATSTLYYLLTDQLGSTSIVVDDSEQHELISELRYDAWGQIRYPANHQNPGPSDYTYTGQYSNVDDFELMYYIARWYDPTIARFAQADTIVPGGVQGYDRYAYTANNPIRYNDPSGHCVTDPLTAAICGAAAGFVVSYAIQTVQHLQAGDSLAQAVSWSSMDKKALIVATVGGAIAGGTMGLASGFAAEYIATNTLAGAVTTFAVTNVAGGALANAAAGQAEALTSAALNDDGSLNTEDTAAEYIEKAGVAGFGKWNTIRDDLGTGAIIGTLSGIVETGISVETGSRPGIPFYLRTVKVAKDEMLEYMNQDFKKPATAY